jgi:nucleoid DNA-binding protein
MKHITTNAFIKRLSKRTGLGIPKSQILVRVMCDQITRDIAAGKRVRLKGIGVMHRVNYANLPDRDAKGRKIVHVHPEQFYACFGASCRLKHLMQKAYNTTTITVGPATERKLRPHEIARLKAAQNIPVNVIARPAPEPSLSNFDSHNGPVNVIHSQSPADDIDEAGPTPTAPINPEDVPIRINVKPKFPDLSWRINPEHRYVSAGFNHNRPGHRMLQSLLRQLGCNWHSITLTPETIVGEGQNGTIVL